MFRRRTHNHTIQNTSQNSHMRPKYHIYGLKQFTSSKHFLLYTSLQRCARVIALNGCSRTALNNSKHSQTNLPLGPFNCFLATTCLILDHQTRTVMIDLIITKVQSLEDRATPLVYIVFVGFQPPHYGGGKFFQIHISQNCELLQHHYVL